MENYIIEHTKILLFEFVSELLGPAAKLRDQLIDTAVAERFQRRPKFHAPRPARHLGRIKHAIAPVADLNVSIAGLQSADQGIAITAEDDAAVVGAVQSFVGVDRPGVRQFDAGGQMGRRLAGTRPQAKGAVNMYPGARFPRRLAKRLERVEGAAVDIARLQD